MPPLMALFCLTGIESFASGSVVKGIGFFIIALGATLNFLVVAVNGWRMPVRVPQDLSEEEGPRGLHKRMDSRSRLTIFADIIPVGRRITISVGDVLLVVGAIVSFLT